MILDFRKVTLLITALFLTMWVSTVVSFANNIGLSITSNSIDKDVDYGVYGDYEKDFGDFGFELEGKLDSGIGYIEPAITFDVGSTIDVRVVSTNDVKIEDSDNYSIEGRLGLDAVIPINNVDFSVGVFGRNNAGEFSPVQRYIGDKLEGDTLTGAEKDPNSPDVSKLLSLPDGFGAGLSVKGEFDVSYIEVGLQGLFEIYSSDDEDGIAQPKVHQLLVDLSTGGSLSDKLNWTVQSRIKGFASIEDEEDNGYGLEYSVITGIEYAF